MAGNNAINNQSFSYNGMPLWGVNFVRLQGSVSTSPSATIYTVPSGKKAVGYQFMYRNTSGGSRTISTRYIISGNNYDTSTIISTSNNASLGEGINTNSSLLYPGAMVMNAGESFAILGATAASVQYFITMLEFDDNVPWYSARNLNINASPFTLYTVPTGKKALIGVQTYMGSGTAWSGSNTSQKSIYFVDNGNVLNANNLVYFFTTPAVTTNCLSSTSNENQNCMAVLSSGDTIQVTQATLTGTNWMFCNVYEVNN